MNFGAEDNTAGASVGSNQDTYPYFLRTVPPDSIQGQAFWNWIVAFEVPLAVCLYAVEPYGQGLFLAIEEQSKLAGEEGRLKGVSVRYMPSTFVVEEAGGGARGSILIAKSLGSRFIFVPWQLGRGPAQVPLGAMKHWVGS
eukprot:Skav223708  [mRNA]  locus=scaffold2379:79569:83229:+ [translate_table: standard]